MAKFYGTKIKNGDINSKTGKPWTLDDVPRLWKKATEKWLAANAD